jgi:hypothetical protein
MKGEQVTSITIHLVGVIAKELSGPQLLAKSINDLEQVLRDSRRMKNFMEL